MSFTERHGRVALKPLDGMGGASVFIVDSNDSNRNVIVETLTGKGQRFIMAQQYLAAIKHGDKRILLIDGKPVERALARVPKAGDARGNLAAGGIGKGVELSARGPVDLRAGGAHTAGAGAAFRGPGCHRRLPDGDQCHKPHLR